MLNYTTQMLAAMKNCKTNNNLVSSRKKIHKKGERKINIKKLYLMN